MMLSQSEMKIALGDFVQRESPLVRYARSLRMELADAKSDTVPSKESEEGNVPSLLKGIDLDTLPADVRKTLEAREAEFKTNLTDKQKLETDLKKTQDLARNHQSRADAFHTKLKQHDLLDDNRTPSNKSEDALVQTLTTKFIAKGMDPKNAGIQAQIFATVMPEMAGIATNQALSQVAPLGTAVSSMQMEQALNQAKSLENDPNGYLSMPEIEKSVREQATFLATQNTAIDLATINNLRAMAVGNYINEHGIEKMTSMRGNQNQQQQQPSNFGGNNFGTGGYRNTNRQQGGANNGAPKAVDIDTQRAAEATIASMLGNIKRK